MYKIWIVEDFNTLSDEDENALQKYLPRNRRNRIRRKRNSIDRKAMTVSWLMLILMMKRFFHIENFEVEYNHFGKPEILDVRNVHFNISHCKTGCICAVSDQPIGVDIQEIRPFSWSVAKFACCTEELEVLNLAENPANEFTRMWVRKESLLKMIGVGIGKGLRNVNTLKYQESIPVIERDGTFIAIASPDMLGEDEICID